MKKLFALLVLILAFGCSSSSQKGTQDVTEVVEDTGSEVTGDVTPVEEDVTTPSDIQDVSRDTMSDTTSPEVADLIAKGKQALHNAEPVDALGFFNQALDIEPENNAALFGASLAQTISAVEMIGMLATLESQYQGYGAGSGTRGTENDYMADTLSGLFDSMRKEFLGANADLKKVDPKGFQWKCDTIPVYFGSGPMMVYGTTFDSSDLPLMLAVQDFTIWALDLITAQNLSSDLVTAYRLVKSMDNVPTGGVILKVIAYLSAYSDTFLKLDETRGIPYFQDGAQRMVQVGEDLLSAYEIIQAETPSDDQVSVWDSDKSAIVVRNMATVDENGNAGVKTLLFQGGKDFVSATQNLLDALKKDTQIVPISDGLYLQLGTILVAATRLGILDSFGVSLPIDISGLDAIQIKAALATLAKADVGLDFSAFHKSPHGLSVILPALKPGYATPFDAELYIEWECPDELAANGGFPTGSSGLVCSKDAKLTDSAHFKGTPYEIPADSVASGLPYIAWADPTMGGLLYVDKGKMDGGESNFVPADNYSLNIVLHQLLKLFLK